VRAAIVRIKELDIPKLEALAGWRCRAYQAPFCLYDPNLRTKMLAAVAPMHPSLRMSLLTNLYRASSRGVEYYPGSDSGLR
jgi:hypothetical protein